MAKTLIAFYSRAGENYGASGIEDLVKGNTEVAADMIQEITGADMFKIETVQEYPANYTKCTEVAKKELQENARPEMKGLPENFQDYDTIILGYPNWWSHMPMVVYNFLESLDFNGKVIMPFCTHGGGGFSGTEKEIKRLCPDATVERGLAINGASVHGAKRSIENWLK